MVEVVRSSLSTKWKWASLVFQFLPYFALIIAFLISLILFSHILIYMLSFEALVCLLFGSSWMKSDYCLLFRVRRRRNFGCKFYFHQPFMVLNLYCFQEILKQVRNFVKGSTRESEITASELIKSALFLLRSLPSARQAVLEHLSNVFDEAVNTHILKLDLGNSTQGIFLLGICLTWEQAHVNLAFVKFPLKWG